MNSIAFRTTLAVCVVALTSFSVSAVTVPGSANPWLAGMPDGTTADAGDSAPAQSPVLLSIVLVPGSSLSWAASGTVSHGGEVSAPDGGTPFSHQAGAEHGKSDILSPINALLGVFLDDSQPDATPAPGALDFSTAASRDYLSISPLLKQVFFMGDGETSTSLAQEVVIPTGATRLFLGTMDGFGWFNNSGSFDVTFTSSTPPVSTPEGGSTALLLLAAIGVCRWAAAHRR